MIEHKDSVEIDGVTYVASTNYVEKYGLDRSNFNKYIKSDRYDMIVIKLSPKCVLVEDIKPILNKKKSE